MNNAIHPTNAFHADSPGVYSSDKILNLSTIDKIDLKCDVFDDSVINGTQQPILFSFILDKLSSYKVFCEPKTIHFKKIYKSVLKNIKIYLDDKHEKVIFNGETLTFTLQMIGI